MFADPARAPPSTSSGASNPSPRPRGPPTPSESYHHLPPPQKHSDRTHSHTPPSATSPGTGAFRSTPVKVEEIDELESSEPSGFSSFTMRRYNAQQREQYEYRSQQHKSLLGSTSPRAHPLTLPPLGDSPSSTASSQDDVRLPSPHNQLDDGPSPIVPPMLSYSLPPRSVGNSSTNGSMPPTPTTVSASGSRSSYMPPPTLPPFASNSSSSNSSSSAGTVGGGSGSLKRKQTHDRLPTLGSLDIGSSLGDPNDGYAATNHQYPYMPPMALPGPPSAVGYVPGHGPPPAKRRNSTIDPNGGHGYNIYDRRHSIHSGALGRLRSMKPKVPEEDEDDANEDEDEYDPSSLLRVTANIVPRSMRMNIMRGGGPQLPPLPRFLGHRHQGSASSTTSLPLARGNFDDFGQPRSRRDSSASFYSVTSYGGVSANASVTTFASENGTKQTPNSQAGSRASPHSLQHRSSGPLLPPILPGPNNEIDPNGPPGISRVLSHDREPLTSSPQPLASRTSGPLSGSTTASFNSQQTQGRSMGGGARSHSPNDGGQYSSYQQNSSHSSRLSMQMRPESSRDMSPGPGSREMSPLSPGTFAFTVSGSGAGVSTTNGMSGPSNGHPSGPGARRMSVPDIPYEALEQAANGMHPDDGSMTVGRRSAAKYGAVTAGGYPNRLPPMGSSSADHQSQHYHHHSRTHSHRGQHGEHDELMDYDDEQGAVPSDSYNGGRSQTQAQSSRVRHRSSSNALMYPPSAASSSGGDGVSPTNVRSVSTSFLAREMGNGEKDLIGNGPAGPYSRTPELRVTHKLAERKRRKEMKDLFDELRESLPADRGMKASKWEILSKAVDFIANLKDNIAARDEEVDRLRQENAMLRGQPYQAQSSSQRHQHAHSNGGQQQPSFVPSNHPSHFNQQQQIQHQQLHGNGAFSRDREDRHSSPSPPPSMRGGTRIMHRQGSGHMRQFHEMRDTPDGMSPEP